jgi:hypothetical protein
MVISLLVTIPPVKITWSMLERGHSYSVGALVQRYQPPPRSYLRNSLQLAGLSQGKLGIKAPMPDVIDHLRASIWNHSGIRDAITWPSQNLVDTFLGSLMRSHPGLKKQLRNRRQCYPLDCLNLIARRRSWKKIASIPKPTISCGFASDVHGRDRRLEGGSTCAKALGHQQSLLCSQRDGLGNFNQYPT